MNERIRTHSENEQLVAERRAHISQVAAKLFAKKGYLATGIREIAQACKMTMGTLYYYIGSKEDILYLTLTRSSVPLHELIRDLTSHSLGMSATESMKYLIQSLLRWMDQNQDEVVFIYHETRNMDQRSKDVVFERDVQIVNSIKAVLDKGTKSGEFKLEDTELAAHNILVLLHSWAFRRWFFKKHHTLEEHIEKETSLILRAIGTHALNSGSEQGVQKK
jgi:AcrR family transcriptional regulator